ncbi:CDP-glucose 4,6-dehydratase [Glaciecola petra]|uniref:CDP-glucose 4,6-dehydratase n=1 Tax=Glaciecola petra TaxID=3075602 RepID=A0ABU2ZMB2_9ALTE|nr:CDP-glucose 4,6-dehydratase [Aestuariibacter sp. P117]MDT0593758.1 CDP-glucose 4,6-dehydratase [Aestuariibacter sp. P117]
MNRLAEFYAGKKVLITGHTGFKGVWLTAWLRQLNADVIGYALDPPSEPSNFEACHMENRITHVEGDVCDAKHLEEVFETYNPDIVFHLAAQSLVRYSIDQPADTYAVNVIGTVNVLEAARKCESVQAVISVTSDKCYKNQNWQWGYRETDELGGMDPYSSSKACAELVVSCLSDSRYQLSAGSSKVTPIASVRAGNVIGGGDWAADRIIPDIIRAIDSKQNVIIRSPKSTRPWQHVLEPLSGYLWLGVKLAEDPETFLGGWNFGPKNDDIWTVKDIVHGLLKRWNSDDTKLIIDEDKSGAESKLLKLDCSKALSELDWKAIWSVPTVLDAIVEWYQLYLSNSNTDMYDLVLKQIQQYTADAETAGQTWAQQTNTVGE